MTLLENSSQASPTGHATTPSRLFFDLDCISWGWNAEEVVPQCHALMEELEPMWVRVANWQPTTVEFLKRYPGQRVMWKLECTSPDTFAVSRTGHSWADDLTAEMLALDIQLVPYTYNNWNVDRFRRDVRALRELAIGIVPIAQPPCLAVPDRTTARGRLGFAPDDIVVGVGGRLDGPYKGIQEVVEAFLHTCDDPRIRLIVQTQPPGRSRRIFESWQSHPAARDGRLVLRVGNYGCWENMTTFYRSLDCFLINSTRESWCRMLTEAVGYGVPTVVRRADCATNHVVPGITVVDHMSDFNDPSFQRAMRAAAAKAEKLRSYVHRTYAPAKVRQAFLELMGRHTDESLGAIFDAYARDASIAARIDPSLIY